MVRKINERRVSEIANVVRAHPCVKSLKLTGSHAHGNATALSDWDFLVEVSNFNCLRKELPRLVAPFEPLTAQWDQLSDRQCYMLVVKGPAKIDLIFARIPNPRVRPWALTPAALKEDRSTLLGLDSVAVE
jgi:hypothetical protein